MRISTLTRLAFKHTVSALAEELYLGLREMADEFQTPIVGGDTNSWDGPLVISVTVLGEVTGRGPVRRSGARPGDWLLVSGPLGGSIRGKHLSFTPRVQEAIQLHDLVPLHAMIDISDGLAADVRRCGSMIRSGGRSANREQGPPREARGCERP